MTIDDIKGLANAIHDAMQSQESQFILQGFSSAQEDSNLYPVNEIEAQRLWKMARYVWFLGRAYERLYAYENNSTQENG